MALLAPDGAGKTTLFNAISGYVESTEGTIYFKGTPIHGLAPHEISIKGVRRTFQNGGLFPELTALENVLAGLHVHIDGSFLGIVMGLGEAREAEREGIARARRLLDLMDLGAIADQPVKDLSGGQQRMVEIVRTLATEPPLLLLDEPVVGLSPPMRDRMMEIIRRLAGEEGIGIMRRHRSGRPDAELTDGPGKLCQALRINLTLNGSDLVTGETLFVERGQPIDEGTIRTTPRIRVTGDVAAVTAPWRFVTENPRRSDVGTVLADPRYSDTWVSEHHTRRLNAAGLIRIPG